jgi:hypothetical protein
MTDPVLKCIHDPIVRMTVYSLVEDVVRRRRRRRKWIGRRSRRRFQKKKGSRPFSGKIRDFFFDTF